MRTRATAVLIGLVLAGQATGQTGWTVDPAASSITFRYAFSGDPQEGRFTEVSGTGRFDAARPEATRFTLTIPVRSLDLGNWLVTGFALGPDWFGAAAYPEARYQLTRLSVGADGTATAVGDLTIKGHRETIAVPLALAIGAEEARASGSLAFDPRSFGVGVGPSAVLVNIGDTVAVSFDILARRAADGAETGSKP